MARPLQPEGHPHAQPTSFEPLAPPDSAIKALGSDVLDISWTYEEERSAVRKADAIVMPLLMLSFFALQLDRVNAGNALTDNFLQEVGISQNSFNVGIQLLNVGIIVLEIPSNMVLYHSGPKLWIPGQIVAWGLVATFQAFQHGLGAFLSTRLLLGLLEAGFIPGGLYILSLWYKRSELSKRFALYFMGNGLATASGGLIAYGILHLRGTAGLSGWQWLFILEGLFTLLVGATFACLFPGTPDDPITLTKIRFFTPREQCILQSRIRLDHSNQVKMKDNIEFRDIRRTLADLKVWPHILLAIIGCAPSTALWSYAPSIIASFGYDRLAANALTSVGSWVSVTLVLILGFVA